MRRGLREMRVVALGSSEAGDSISTKKYRVYLIFATSRNSSVVLFIA